MAFENKTPKQAIEGRTVFLYGRVSSEEQGVSLPAQIDFVKDELKRLGYRKSLRGRVFSEQASGTTLERPELAKALQAMQDFGGPAVLVVRDIQRFSRDPYGLGVLYRPLWEQDIPVVALTEQLVLGTRKNPSPNSDLLAPILVAAGGTEVSLTKARSLAGVKQARAKGISAGAPMNVYTSEPLNPYREQVRLLEAGIGQKTGSTRLGRSGAWWRKSRDKLQRIRERKGDQGVEESLSMTDLLRDLESQFGPRFGKGVRRQGMVAVGRITSLYLQKPEEVERPTDEFVMEVFNDPKPFLPKRRRGA